MRSRGLGECNRAVRSEIFKRNRSDILYALRSKNSNEDNRCSVFDLHLRLSSPARQAQSSAFLAVSLSFSATSLSPNGGSDRLLLTASKLAWLL